MYEFVDRLFGGPLFPESATSAESTPTPFDGRGNYSMGLKLSSPSSPKSSLDKIDKVRGMDICFVTTATGRRRSRELLTLLGAPFAK